MRKLENLDVWKDSRILVVSIYKLMDSVRDHGFRDQIQRASVSIMNNIAEGFESGSDIMFCRYLKISKASCSEVRSMLYLCDDLKFCTSQKSEELQAMVTSIANRLSKLIAYLENKKIVNNNHNG